MKQYGQFCGLARAAEIVGERWALLVLRDLAAGPRRYTDLREGLPGIPSNVLATRLKELEASGLVTRAPADDGTRAIRYRLTDQGHRIEPALRELSLWGASTMTTPREGEVFTDAALAMALRTAFMPGRAHAPRTLEVRAAGAVAGVRTDGTSLDTWPGEATEADVSMEVGPGFRALLAQPPASREPFAQLEESDEVTVTRGEQAGARELLDRLHVPWATEAEQATA